MAVFHPNLKPESFNNDSIGEFIFVVDRSGSMSGKKIQQAQQTLLLCLASLPQGTLFNIVGFGSDFRFLFVKGSVVFDDSNKLKGVNYCKAMQADLGGTELLMPLQAIFRKPPKHDRPRQIFLFTDGEVDNTREIKDFVKRENLKNGTRFFCFGIGSQCSHNLVNSVAKAGSGKSEFIEEGDNMQAKVMRQLSFALSPTLKDIKVDWGTIPLSDPCTPANPLPLFHGDRFLSYAFSSAAMSSQTEKCSGMVGINVDTPDGHHCFELSLSENCLYTRGYLIHVFAAKSLLTDYEEKYDQAIDNSLKESIKQSAIHLSELFSIVCRWTSFIGIESRQDAVFGSLQTIEVPLSIVKVSAFENESDLSDDNSLVRFKAPQKRTMLAKKTGQKCAVPGPRKTFAKQTARKCTRAGSRNSSKVPKGAEMTKNAMHKLPWKKMSVYKTARKCCPVQNFQADEESEPESIDEECGRDDEEEASALCPTSKNASLYASNTVSTLATLQSACGSWELTEQVVIVLKQELPVMKAKCSSMGIQGCVFITAFVLGFLDKTLSNNKYEWSLYAQKARKWLERTVGKEKAQSTIEGLSEMI